jgi:hypothetical protein
VCRPCPIQWDQPSGVDSPAENVFRDEFAFVPNKILATVLDGVLSLPNTTKPVPVRVIAVFEPFVDEQVGGIMAQALAHEFAG